MSGLGEGVTIAWAGFGVKTENIEETTESLTIYISVPETSDHRNVRDEMMAGDRLAKRFKEAMAEMGVKRLIVKYRIRKGDHWTDAKKEAAEIEMRKSIYGSQW